MNMNKATQQKLLQKIKSDYEKIATEFSDTRIRPWPEMEEFKKYIKEGDRVLDLGCGNGRLYQVFKDLPIEYVGMDSNKRLIEIAKQNFQFSIFLKGQVSKASNFQINPKTSTYPSAPAGAGRPACAGEQNPKPNQHVNFLVGDITKSLPFADNFFDLVFMIASFHHIPGRDLRKQVLMKIKRVIKPDGLLIMTNWNLWQPRLVRKYRLWRLLFGLKYKNMDQKDTLIPWKLKNGEIIQRYYHTFTFKELKILFQQTGWKVIKQYYTRQKKQLNWLKGNNLVSITQPLFKSTNIIDT